MSSVLCGCVECWLGWVWIGWNLELGVCIVVVAVSEYHSEYHIIPLFVNVVVNSKEVVSVYCVVLCGVDWT